MGACLAMKFYPGAVRTRVTELSENERAWLDSYCSFADKKSHFEGRGEVHLFSELTETFPAGLTMPAAKAAAEAGHTVEIDWSGWNLEELAPRDPQADLAWLDEDQRPAVGRALDRGRGIIWIPTAGGKTECAIGLVRAVPGKWLYVAHRATLCWQTAARFDLRTKEHGIYEEPAGVIAEKQFAPSERLTCCSFKALELLGRKDPEAFHALVDNAVGLIADESHCLPAATYYAVANAIPAPRRIGLSATPLARGDRRSILAVASLGPVIFRVRNEALEKRGRVAKMEVRMVALQQPPSRKEGWAAVENERIVKSTARNKLLVDIAKRAAKPAFLFVRRVSHGHTLVKMLGKAGLRTQFVYGEHSTDWRESAVDALKRERLDVLVCSVVFQEGLDLPELASTINGAGQESTIAAVQKLGRSKRVERDAQGNVVEGGDVGEFWDVYDVGSRFLERWSKSRRKAYEEEGYRVEVENPELLELVGNDVPPKKAAEAELSEVIVTRR